MTEAICY